MSRLHELSLPMAIDEVQDSDGTSHLRFVFSPPLGAGLRTIPVPRTPLEFLIAKRNLAQLSTARGLARAVVHAATKAAERFSHCDTQIYLSDGELISGHGRFTNAEIEGVARLMSAVAEAVLAELGSQPIPLWKRTVLAAWGPLAAELGAMFDVDELRMTLRRADLEVRASLRMGGDDTWTTRLEVTVGREAAARAAELSELAHAFADEGTSACIEAGELVVTRSGIVADARYLKQLVDTTFDLAIELSRGAGPYRS
jgi:hypothetical protein